MNYIHIWGLQSFSLFRYYYTVWYTTPAAHLVGMKSKRSTNGGHMQGGHLAPAGRADIVRRVISGGKKQRAVARDVDSPRS